MDPPPARPKGVTFVALLLGLVAAASMPQALLHLTTGRSLEAGLALLLVVSNVALLVGAVGLWWMREAGRTTAIAGLALRIAYGVAFALLPRPAGARVAILVSSALLVLAVVYLVRVRPAFVAR